MMKFLSKGAKKDSGEYRADGIETEYSISDGDMHHLKGVKEYLDGQLSVDIIKTSLSSGTSVPSSKLLPLIVRTMERRGDKRFVDVYSFDNNGVCLSHGFSRYDGGVEIVSEQHDQNASGLREHSSDLVEMFGGFPLNTPMVADTTVADIRNGTLD